MNDYKQIMKDIILQYYATTPDGGKIIQMQTANVLNWFRGIIPNEPIDQHDIFELLLELGFIHSQKIITEKVKIKKNSKYDEDKYEEKEITRILVWNLYEIN